MTVLLWAGLEEQRITATTTATEARTITMQAAAMMAIIPQFGIVAKVTTESKSAFTENVPVWRGLETTRA